MIDELPEIVYGYELEKFYDQDPTELAEECLDWNGGSEVEIYQGVPYRPEEGEQRDLLSAEGFSYLVKDIKVFGIYKDGAFV